MSIINEDLAKRNLENYSFDERLARLRFAATNLW
jgi:hypothetical protein